MDQLNVADLVGAEVSVRKYQEIEEEAVKEEELSGSHPTADFYRGRPKLSGGMCVCPELQEWASKKVERRVNLMKYKAKLKELKEKKKPG